MLKRRKYLTLPEIRRLVIQVCGAVKYLHYRHIVHRDLKTGNLFLDSNMNVKVGDFGLAALLVTEREMEVKRRTTMCGTPNYLAPEILEKGKGHNEKVDLWAIGVIAYTLAVGKAPFHASTKEEIYKKLKSGTFTWPELSATTNQSADLRDLVSSLLVPEEERPAPDQIVSHTFFRIAYVPSSIPETAREKPPTWPEIAVPSAETIRRGYSDTWFSLCKESGVGEYETGKCFPLNGGRKVRSIVHDMTKEAQAGRQPTMPIPKDVVYTSTVSDFDGSRESSPSMGEPPKKGTSRGLKEISHNEVAAARPRRAGIDTEKAAKDAELMPPPRAPSRAARSGTVRRPVRTTSDESAKPSTDAVGASNSATLRIARTRPPPVSSTSASKTVTAAQFLKESNISEAYRTAPSNQPSDGSAESLEKPQRAGTTKRAADASLARRPRGARTLKERPMSPVEVPKAPAQPAAAKIAKERQESPPDAPGPLATLDEMKDALPYKSRRGKTLAEVIEILSDPESEEKEKASESAPLQMPRPPKMAGRLPVPRRPLSTTMDSSVPETDPSIVLEKLSAFRDNLASTLQKPSTTSRTATAPSHHNTEAAAGLPFVSRWVDYSRKHGVGYVLSDGTVGCIINASQKPNQPPTPVTHVLVRNGQRWLAKVGKNKDFAGIDQVPLEIFEDCADDGIKRKIYKGLGSVKEGPLLVEAERRRTLSVLWVKFGRYMCQSLDGDESEPLSKGDNFVRFYQRVGSVGVWAFRDGCLQVHFPDHTKLVLSADGKHLSFTALSLEATQHLAQNGDLQPQHVNSRQLYQDSVHSLLHEGGRVRLRVLKANQLQEKLNFLQQVVGQWAGNEGLGKLDEDFVEGSEKLVWRGMAVRDQNARKVERVTVGRRGGDEVLPAVK